MIVLGPLRKFTFKRLEETLHPFPIPLEALSHRSTRELREAYDKMSEAYSRLDDLDAAYDLEAYILGRMPATYAIAASVLAEVPFKAKTLLDLGSGPGPLTLAALETQELTKVTLLDKHGGCLRFAEKMLAAYGRDRKRAFEVKTTQSDVTAWLKDNRTPYDLVGMGHFLSEVADWQSVLLSAYHLATSGLILYGPGTPDHFERFRLYRTFLLEHGATLLAPCAHELPCPMTPGQDWCHFSVKVQRSALHQKIKGGSLPFEYEKTCYLVVGKSPGTRRARILRNPLKRKGHILFTVCAEDGQLNQEVISKKSPDWSRARKLDWGDAF